MKQSRPNRPSNKANNTDSLPVLFIGHGSPMNAIEDNEFSRSWRELGESLPRPKAVLCISAHWETEGTLVTAMEKPATIHDFGGFPQELFEVQYPAPGSQWLAREITDTLKQLEAAQTEDWGLDHGTWSVLTQMFPAADIPVVQLSLDSNKSAPEHLALAKELAPLRQKGVLILGSGNMVHNLGRVVVQGHDFNQPFGLDWAIKANGIFKQLIEGNRHAELANYRSLGAAVQLAVPTPEHYLPLLYALALKQEHEKISYFNDQLVGGSLSMTSFVIDAHAHFFRANGV